jgi:hypothetical protein
MTRDQLRKLLTNTRPGDKIKIKSTGEIVVKQTKAEIIQQEYPHLAGQGITLSEAAKKYGVPRSTIEKWHYNDYISVIENSYPIILNEAEIAYCADIYHARKAAGIGFRGVPLLDENGLAYELKHEVLAKNRRRKNNLPK